MSPNIRRMKKLIYLFSLSALFSLAGPGHRALGQCKDLRKIVDKFDGAITLTSPYYRGPNHEPIFVTKRKSSKGLFFFVHFAIWANPSTSKRGIYLILADGQKLEFPDEEVTFRYSNRWFANGSILLTPEQLELLCKVPITDVRLAYFDRELTKKEGVRFKDYLYCLTTVSDDEVKER